jgi:hypothetical protein
MTEEHYASWEWRPIDLMPNGCNDVEVRDNFGGQGKICSCDYWQELRWSKATITDFRFV